MRIKTAILCCLVALVGSAAGGCSDENVTLHKPGVYKGAKDPLVEKQGTQEQQDTLVARFKQVQTDR